MQVVIEKEKLHIPAAIDFPKVRQFLESKARNSKGTAKTYAAVIGRLQKFLEDSYPQYNVETILAQLKKKKGLDVYRFFDQLISYWHGKIKSVNLTVDGLRSYFQYWDIEILPHKFRNKVTLPKIRKEDERALDKSEVRQLLLNADHPRLRAYLLVLATAGPRAVEALMLRFRDVDFTANPAKLYMRAEFSKNKLPREIYITPEAADYLQKWLAVWSQHNGRDPAPDDLIFSLETNQPQYIYEYANMQFMRLLDRVGLNQRKADSISKYKRHEITLHSFRRFAETTIEDATGLSFADYILGHKKSVYYTKKEPERRALYAEKCAKVLTFLDYDSLDAREKGIEHELKNKDYAIERLSADVENLKELVRALKDRD